MSEVILSPEDVEELLKFVKYFDVEGGEGLSAAVANFKNNPTVETQDELKFELAKLISESNNPVFQDEVFKDIRPETQEVYAELCAERGLTNKEQ